MIGQKKEKLRTSWKIVIGNSQSGNDIAAFQERGAVDRDYGNRRFSTVKARRRDSDPLDVAGGEDIASRGPPVPKLRLTGTAHLGKKENGPTHH